MNFKNLLDIAHTFDSEKKCIEHLASLRWPDGVICPRCEESERINWIRTKQLWWCGGCKRQFSIRIGTIFEESRLPLLKWFMAIWLLTSHQKGISSHQLARDIGVTQKTAWSMLKRLREVMPLLGDGGELFEVVDIDDGYIDGKEANNHKSRGSQKTKTAVFGLVKCGGKSRAHKVPDLKGQTIRVIVGKNVIPDSQIISDKFRGYQVLGREVYAHDTVNHGGEYVRGRTPTNTIESAWSLFKCRIVGVYHQCRDKHLQRYLNEFSGRTNIRNMQDHERVNQAFSRVVELRLTYKDLIGGKA